MTRWRGSRAISKSWWARAYARFRRAAIIWCSLPILRAVGEKKPGMIHFDAHTDLYDSYFGGFKYTHGTPFRRAIEEGVLDPKRTIQIGLRGSMYDLDDFKYGEKMGVRLMRIEEAVELGPQKVMEIARGVVGDQGNLCELRHRHARSGLCAGHRDARRSAGSLPCRRSRCCAGFAGSIWWEPMWLKCRRPSMRRE